MSARDVIAKQIEPQAWAALGIGDTIAYRNRRVSSERKSDRIIAALNAAGYVILSPDEVRGIRDEALEEAAVAAERTYAKDPFRFELNTAAAATIRSMKGGRDAQ